VIAPVDHQEERAHVLTRLAAMGKRRYLGEPVTVIEHSLQTAHLAEREGAALPLVAAALLHDIGWLLRGGSRHHDLRGAAFLAEAFGPDVSEPVRLHVTAKRYLCSVEPGYHAALSAASVRTLRTQGGLLDTDGVGAFEAEPYCADAITLRRLDDRAKVPGTRTPGLAHYRRLLELLGRSS
jgi:predicted HD phosphohydrolase